MESPVKIWDLPDEVLCYIFSKLNVKHVIICVAQVCQQWRWIVAENKKFWVHVPLVIDCDNFFNHSFLHDTCTNQLHTADSHYVKEGIYFGEKDLDFVTKAQTIIFTEGSSIIDQSIFLLKKIIDIVSNNCHSVEKVAFFHCYGVTSIEVIRFLREKFSDIKEFCFGYNRSLMFRLPCDEIARFKYLKTLVSSDIMFKSSDLFYLSEWCEHLISLWIMLCGSLKSGDIMHFLERKKNTLKELGLGIKMQDCILNKLQECHSLEVFFSSDASELSDAALVSFAYQSRLKYCSLHRAKFLRQTVFNVAGPSRKPEFFKYLKLLDLTGYQYYQAKFFVEWEYSSTNANEESRPMGFVAITFNNPPLPLLTKSSYSLDRNREHWMYRHLSKTNWKLSGPSSDSVDVVSP